MPMRALLIGAQTYELAGVHADVALMKRVLADRGFTDLRICTGSDACYHGMADALKELAQATRDGDAVVIYYSGHGSLLPAGPFGPARLTGQDTTEAPSYLQYLVPVDHQHSTATDFRGYLAEELTAAVRLISKVTPNVTCVLDCCHSGAMVRDPGRWRIKSVPSEVPSEAGLARATELATTPRRPDPDVVRLVACQQHGYAYERRGGKGEQGLFTAVLAELLDHTRDRPIPWSALIARVRDRILPQTVLQRPDAGGPSGRLPFSIQVPVQPERLPLEQRGGQLLVPGGVLLGLGGMDRVRLVLPDDGPADTTAEAEVASADAADALLHPPRHPLPSPLPPGSYALPVRVHTRYPVHIAASGPFADALRERLAASPRLTETGREDEVFASVRSQGRSVEVVNAAGLRCRHALDVSDARRTASEYAHDLMGLLEDLARGQRLRQLADPAGAGRLDVPVEARFEVETEPGSHRYRTFRPDVDLLYGQDRYRVTATSHSRRESYLWLLGVGLSGRTALVTNDQPSGIRLQPVRSPDASATTWDSGPVEIWWPHDVPREGERLETVLLLVGDRQLDLNPLASPVRNRKTEPDGLGALLDEIWGGVRDSRSRNTAETLRYRVFKWHATIEPAPE